MENLFVSSTQQSLEINLQADGNLILSGISTPDNVITFFNPVNDWIVKYLDESCDYFQLEFFIDYLNTSSTRILIDILRVIKTYQTDTFTPIIKWNYETDDEDILELGEELALISKLEFEYIAI